MATVTRTQYEVRRVVRNIPGTPFLHDNFHRRLQAELNELAMDEWEVQEIGIGRFDAVIVASAEFIMEEDDAG